MSLPAPLSRIAGSIALATAGAAFLGSGGLFGRATGFVAVAEPGGSDLGMAWPEPSLPAAGQFLQERNALEFEIRDRMSVGEMLARYRLDFPHVREQLRQQLALPVLADDALVPPGRRFQILLTPPDTTMR
jgi:hypothetical protein